MPQGKCKNPDCTLATTGICLESHVKVEECPNYYLETAVDRKTEEIGATSPSLPIQDQSNNDSGTPQLVRHFYIGNEIGTLDAIPILQKRYTHVIGILGSTGAGKTCLLASLYLLASHSKKLPDYLFAGSFTLQGFEERARGLRCWSASGLPEQVVGHTRLLDPRRPAFMHICLKENKVNGEWKDLLITDLPGEWTDEMIDNSSKAIRFSFLRRADGIIYVIDGPEINKEDHRHIEVYKAKIAIDRLVENVLSDLNVPIILAISKCDEIKMQYPKAVKEISLYAVQRGLKSTVIQTIAFSRNPDEFDSGIGVMEMFTSAFSSVRIHDQQSEGWIPTERSFWSFSAT